MNLEELMAKFEVLENKTMQLISACDHLKEEARLSAKENDELKAVIKKQAGEIKALSKKTQGTQINFHNQHKISKLVSSITADSKETTGLKARIDEYIEQLNKCIAHLSQ